MSRFDREPADRDNDRPPVPDRKFQSESSILRTSEIEAQRQAKTRIDNFERLPRRAREHIFRGSSRSSYISGYHHRFNNVDRGPFIITDRWNEMPNGLYQATVQGLDRSGRTCEKTSSFFPDYMTPEQVEEAIKIAIFGNQKGKFSADRKDELRGTYHINNGSHRGDNFIIVAKFDLPFGQTAADATTKDLVSAWPLIPRSRRGWQ